ncbi:hypothetical protein FRC11_008751 [Ceratobasidium sp. 423]|nr:hypothetical protein FRC11_008751 [Ceratobasidium sp. 423]
MTYSHVKLDPLPSSLRTHVPQTLKETESSGDEGQPPPKPKKPVRPLSVSQIERIQTLLSSTRTATPSKSQSQSAKPPLATPTTHQPSHANPKPSIPPTPGIPQRSSAYLISPGSDNDTSSLPDSPIVSTRQKADKYVALSSDDEPPLLAATVASRGQVQLECNMNGMRTEFESIQKFGRRLDKLEERQTRTEEKQDEAIEKLDALLVLAKHGRIPAPATPAPSTSREEKPKTALTNPPPNPGHYAMADSIQSRRDWDKGS